MTNKGAIIGSESKEEQLKIQAQDVIITTIQDYDKGRDSSIGLSGIDLVNPKAPQTSIGYESYDKAQDTNATFSNVDGKTYDFEINNVNTNLDKIPSHN